MGAEERRGGGLVGRAFGDGPDKALQRLLLGGEVVAVQRKEYEGGHRARALVPVHKGVVAYDVEEAGRRHLLDTPMQELSAEGSRRRRQGDCSNPCHGRPDTPVPLDLIAVDFEQFGEGEELWRRGHCASLSRARPYRALAAFNGRLETAFAARRSRRCDDQRLDRRWRCPRGCSL